MTREKQQKTTEPDRDRRDDVDDAERPRAPAVAPTDDEAGRRRRDAPKPHG
jgi:hypothetical protein